MKKLLMVAALSAAGMVSTGAHAQATGDFTVVINLTAACQVAPIPNMTFNYTSLGAQVNTSTTANITCTTGLPYNLSLDSLSVLDDDVQLTYDLSFTTGTGPFAGTGVAVGHQIDGVIAAGLVGDCGGAASCDNAGATNRTRTLTVTF